MKKNLNRYTRKISRPKSIFTI